MCKSWLTIAVKSTQRYLGCLPLVILSLSFTRLTVFLPNIKHKTLSLDHHWLGSNDFWNCFVSPSLHTRVTDVVWWSMAACHNQAWRAISKWSGCSWFALSFIIHFCQRVRSNVGEVAVFCCSRVHLPHYEPGQSCCSDESSSAYVAGLDPNKTSLMVFTKFGQMLLFVVCMIECNIWKTEELLTCSSSFLWNKGN